MEGDPEANPRDVVHFLYGPPSGDGTRTTGNPLTPDRSPVSKTGVSAYSTIGGWAGWCVTLGAARLAGRDPEGAHLLISVHLV